MEHSNLLEFFMEKKAVSHVKTALTEIVPDYLRSSLIEWMYDSLFHEQSVPNLLETILKIFSSAQRRTQSTSMDMQCFSNNTRWCRLLVS